MIAGLEQQHRARRFLRELAGSVSLQPVPHPMMLVSRHDNQVHSALACQSNDLHRWLAFANFDPGSHLRPEFTIGKLLQSLGALRMTGALLANHIQSAEGTWPFNYVEQDYLRPPSLCQRPCAPQRGHGGLGEIDGHEDFLLLWRGRLPGVRRLARCRQ